MKLMARVIVVALVVALLAFGALVATGWLWPQIYIPPSDGITVRNNELDTPSTSVLK